MSREQRLLNTNLKKKKKKKHNRSDLLFVYSVKVH